MPNVGFEQNSLNKDMTVALAGGGLELFKTKGTILLQAKVIGDHPLAFGPEDISRIFTYEDNQWVEINDLVTYGNIGHIVISPDDLNPTIDLFVRPDLSDRSFPIRVRIFVFAHIYDGSITKNMVTAYVDLYLR